MRAGDLQRILAPSVSQLWLLSLLCAVRRVSHQTDGSWAERRGLCPGPRHDPISAARGAGRGAGQQTADRTCWGQYLQYLQYLDI